MSPCAPIVARQIWAQPTSTAAQAGSRCTPFSLPSGGELILDAAKTITLAADAVFRAQCTGGLEPIVNSTQLTGLGEDKPPFYASTTPQIFAIAAATVVSYVLVIILFIGTKNFFVGGSGSSASNFLSRRGMISGSCASSSLVGIGRRPWLQKIATLTVAISLTIATADTFKVATRQYDMGYMDGSALVDEVAAGLEIRIVRVISDTFLWLAQVQTLIRLFPRHKEKVTIKWLGFALIVLDTIFSILNNFVHQGVGRRPRSFQDAIPALSYLFELAIGFIYASCIIYYSISKRRFAFYNAKMRNICLVALMSLVAVLIPVVFFVLDISKPDVAGWGDYIRWVGAAAASVVVWEWVERIEALEREERKDGILGREIFDGDDMLDPTPSAEVDDTQAGRSSGTTNHQRRRSEHVKKYNPFRFNVRFRAKKTLRDPEKNNAPAVGTINGSPAVRLKSDVNEISMPGQTVTPVSRTDTASAASTVYAVRYHVMHTPSSAIHEDGQSLELDRRGDAVINTPKDISDSASDRRPSVDEIHLHLRRPSLIIDDAPAIPVSRSPAKDPRIRPQPNLLWRVAANPFKRRRASPPAEVSEAQGIEKGSRKSPGIKAASWNPVHKIDTFATEQRSKMKTRAEKRKRESDMAVTVIPAAKRGTGGRTWSPDDTIEPGVEGQDADGTTQGAGEPGPEEPTQTQSRTNPAPQPPIFDPIFSHHVTPPHDSSGLPTVVIPAPSRCQPRTWSPDELRQDQATSPQSAIHDFAGAPYRASVIPPSRSTIAPPQSPRALSKSPVRSRHSPTINTTTTPGLSSPVINQRGSLTFSESPPRDNTDAARKRSSYTRPASSGADDPVLAPSSTASTLVPSANGVADASPGSELSNLSSSSGGDGSSSSNGVAGRDAQRPAAGSALESTPQARSPPWEEVSGSP